jgi:adenylate cyclase
MLKRIARTRPALGSVLAIAFGTLMLLAVGSVLVVSLGGAGRNTTELLADKAELILASLEQRIHQQFEPVVRQAEYLGIAIERGQLDIDETRELAAALRSALGATPQVTGIVFVRPDLAVTRVERADGTAISENWSHRPVIVEAFENARRGLGTGWSRPLWSDQLRQAIIPFVLPVRRGGEVVGLLLAAITVAELSRYVSEISTPAQQAFILYGRDEVLAHPALATQPPRGSPEHPLPRLSAIGDKVLAAIWSPTPGTSSLLGRVSDQVHVVVFGDEYFVYVYREIAGSGEKPWLVGAVLPGSEVGREAERLRLMAGIGAVLLLTSVLAAILGGSFVARPMRSVVAVTEAVRKLDFANAPVLPRSRIREIDAAAQALNAMVAALRWFELYLPKRLVQRLLEQGEGDLARAYERDVTVMFTDVSGFTRTASRLSPAETAEFLNAHFALVGGCVEAEEGTIDKYMGDGVMAFWGAPDAQPDHVERACRAALAIARAVRADNEGRRARGLDPVRMRIGIGTGGALVGNIGAPSRMNYTLVGDTVNVAQRLEQLGKDLPSAGEVTALVTEECHRCLRDGALLESLGRRRVRNRDGEVGVYRLV